MVRGMCAAWVSRNRFSVFADFPEHPSDRLMDEIVPVVQQDFRDIQRIIELMVFDESFGRDDGDSPFPKVRRSGKGVEEGCVSRSEIIAQDV